MTESDWVQTADLPSADPPATPGDLGRFIPGLTLAELERLAIIQTLRSRRWFHS